MSTITVAALNIFPIKSCRGHAVACATLDARGFVGDRRFLIVEESGRAITQRDTPPLTHLTSSVENGFITLAHPSTASVTIASVPTHTPSREVAIWNDTMRAVDLGDEVARWLSALIGRPARLVGTGTDFARQMKQPTARPGDEVAFPDGHPLLVIGEASLAELNGRLDAPMPMNRFRPSIVVRGASAFAEDTWRKIRIGTAILRASEPCGRCVLTTIDQDTLERGKEPLRTLATYRRDARGEVCFGEYYIHETKSGAITVGDVVEILE